MKVGQEEAIVGKQAAETAAVAADAQKDLDRALPALESAVKALKSLTKADITEVKSFTNPPNAVRVVMEAVCVLLGEKADWDTSKKLLGRSDFMDLLTGYDKVLTVTHLLTHSPNHLLTHSRKDNIDAKRLKLLRKQYIPVDEMQPETVQKVSHLTTYSLTHLTTYSLTHSTQLRSAKRASVCASGLGRWMSMRMLRKKLNLKSNG
jgi:N-methylhydantoinase A/oxoprolinase/acetone carboxylase beta subunit